MRYPTGHATTAGMIKTIVRVTLMGEDIMDRVFLFAEAYRDYLMLERDLGPKPKDYSYKQYTFGQFTWGSQHLFQFPNGYGASVVQHQGSYGCQDDLFEVALIKWDQDWTDKWEIVYDASVVTSRGNFEDVLGYLTQGDVVDVLKKIKEV